MSGKNKYYTLYENLRRDILRGKLKSGEKLPSKRTLAAELGVSVVTVQTAFDQLLAEGYISSRERSGYYVCKVELDYREQPEPALRPYEEKKKQVGTDFVSGSTPAELFPFSSWARLLREVLSDCGEHLLERVPSAGDAELRGAISDYLYRARGLYADPERIIIGAGAEQLYGVIVQLVGREKLFAAENPCYRKIYDSYTLNGARCTLLPVGREGVSAADVEQSGASVVHISPAHQYPTGAVMPAAARARIISAVQKRDGYVVEDDYDSEFRLYGKPLQSMYALAPERVIYVNTFSKTLAPSMRMGYMVLPQSLYKRYTELFGHNSSAVPLFEQKALARMISGGGFERHLSRLKNYYRGVREVLFKKLSSLKYEHIIQDSGGGLHFTVKFPAAQTDGQIKEMAAGADIRVRTLSDYLILPAAGFEKTVVVNYSGVTLAKAEALDLSVI